MTQNGGGPDFHLPDEIRAAIPTDPYEQLDLARKITSLAIASRVSKLELENEKMRQKVAEKDRAITELQDKLSRLDRMFQEVDARLKVALEENIMMSKERDSLAQTSKKLARDLAKLEAFKKHLMQSLNDDNSSVCSFNYLQSKLPLQPQESIDIRTCDQSITKASSGKEDEGATSYSASNLVSGDVIQDVTQPDGQKFFITPYISPHLTPTATPKVTSMSASPRGYSAAASPTLISGATSPRKQGHTATSPWYPSSQQSSAATSPTRGRSMPGRTPRIDGKEFFHQARSRLSYEQFGAFLANIKELNAHRQSREETLKKTEEIFGTDNRDLYVSFQGLLNRKLP